MFGADRERRHLHVDIDVERLADRHLGVRQVDRGGRADGSTASFIGQSILLQFLGKSTPFARPRKATGMRRGIAIGRSSG